MHEITDEVLSAYLDDELDGPRRAHVATEIARDPELARRLASLREADALARGAFSEVSAQPIPKSLLQTVSEAAPAPRRRPARKRPRMPLQWLPSAPVPAMTMGLLAGIVLTLLASLPGLLGSGMPVPAGASMRPIHPMQPVAALSRALATAPSDKRHSPGKLSVVVLKTFRSDTGRICRAYRARMGAHGTTKAMAGIACRSGETGWNNELMISLSGPGANQYNPGGAAGGLMSRRAVWQGGAVLSAEKERALLQRWAAQGQ